MCDEKAPMSHRAAMTATKRAFEEMKRCERSETPPNVNQLKEWKEALKMANLALSTQQKLLGDLSERHAVDMAVLGEEMRSELVDREANAARTAERFRVMQDKMGISDSSGYEKAVHSASVIEASISELCSHTSNGTGSKLLYERNL